MPELPTSPDGPFSLESERAKYDTPTPKFDDIKSDLPDLEEPGRVTTFDAVDRPEHYATLSPQPIDVIENWGLHFHEAQVLKYIARAGRKGGPEKRLEDLKKARMYLNRRIKQLEKVY